MRVAVIVVSMLVVATPSEASKSCMSKTEARDVYRTSHLYWHSADHCWDATPTRHRQIIREVQQKNDQPKWHDAMSEMSLDHEPMQTTVQTPWVDRWVDIEPSQLPIVVHRVDSVQVAPPPDMERKPEPMVLSRGLAWLAFIAIVLTLAIIEILFRCTRSPAPRRGRAVV
jgi:hypothetical protein